MKLLKLNYSFLFIIFLTLSLFTCENNEDISQNEETNNPYLMLSMSELMNRYDVNGNADESQNPSGNMTLDFCFEFVFPIDFQTNNNTIITINSLEELVDVLIESDEDSYIVDIVYPFDVLVFNHETDTIESMTIQNDDAFSNLIDDCEFDLDEDDYCYEIYDPVCVEITSAYGESIVLVYPNDCYAGHDGFDENDFLEECDFEDDHDDDWFEDDWFENDCFDLVYPITLENSNGDVVTINSEEGLYEYVEEWYSENCNNVEDCDFDFEVVFPITVEYYSENNEQTQTLVINSEEELDEYVEEYCD